MLAPRTASRKWVLFVTVTFRSPRRRRDTGQACGSGRPNPGFARHVFLDLVAYLEREIGGHVDYLVCDQLGALNGRFHLHGLLAGVGLDLFPRAKIEKWLQQRAGFARVLPFREPAAAYVSRFITCGVEAEWDLSIGETRGEEKGVGATSGTNGRSVVVKSAELPKQLFHQTMPGRRR